MSDTQPPVPDEPQPPPGSPPPPPPPFPPPPGGTQPGWTPPATGWQGPALAEWPQRALAGLIDFVGPSILAAVFFQASTALGFLVWLAALAWALYNAYLNGQTGQSIGKQQVGLRLVRETDGQLIGGAAGVGRYFVHIIDAIPCYIGFLFPLWDSKKQTLADKIMKTVVIVDRAA